MVQPTLDGAAMPMSLAVPPRLMSAMCAAAVRDAIEAYVENGVLDSRLRPAARMVCDDAHAGGFLVEQMLISLKHEWTTLLDARRVPHGVARADLTSRFITLCIYAFYAGHPQRSAELTAGESAAEARA